MTQSTYTFVAADGQTYGPNSHEVIQGWINEGRIARETQMARSDVEGWFKAGDYQEFAWPGAGVVSAPAQVITVGAEPSGAPTVAKTGIDPIDPMSLQGIRDGASWFFWIAGLSLVNFVLILSGSSFGFAIGCIAVDILAALGRGTEGGGILFIIMGALLIGLWGALGIFAKRAHIWAFAVGLILYGLDSLLLFVSFNVISAAIHAWIIYKLFAGLKDAWGLRRALRQMH